jgi:hypothetical protein
LYLFKYYTGAKQKYPLRTKNLVVNDNSLVAESARSRLTGPCRRLELTMLRKLSAPRGGIITADCPRATKALRRLMYRFYGILQPYFLQKDRKS